jgi:zinc finger CCCH domain-containing protein 15
MAKGKKAPPKKKAPQGKPKNVQKVLEDKTFGMKNKKKSKKAQLLVKQAESQQRDHNTRMRGDPATQRKTKKQIQKEKV